MAHILLTASIRNNFRLFSEFILMQYKKLQILKLIIKNACLDLMRLKVPSTAK